MATTVDRDEVVGLLHRQFDALDTLCTSFDDAAWERPTCLPGWTAKDILSHVIGTESGLQGDPAPDADISHLTHLKNPIAAANEVWVESLRPLPGPEVLDRFRAVTARRRDQLDAMTQADFDAPSWTPAGPEETYGRFMRIRHYDCYLHELDISDAVAAEDRTDPPHVAAALTEPVAALGYIAGKKAALPGGATVRIELTGPVTQTHLVEVAERARVVDRLDGEPAAGIALDAVLFLRLTGGRHDPEPYLGSQVRLDGDEALARQLATNLAYTI